MMIILVFEHLFQCSSVLVNKYRCHGVYSEIVKCFKVQMKCFFIAEFERAAKIRKIAVYRLTV